jgi:CheY-like chemotaxis protein
LEGFTVDKVEMDLQGARILLVDDTEANLDVLCALLEAEGCRIALAPNGEIALRIAGRVSPDLILLDVMMPGMDGFEACRRLKQNECTREIPVIFITAENLTKSIVTGFEVGGVDYIIKPFHNEEVLARVRTHLQIDRLTRHLEAANRRIQEATERKSRFLASMSHELRTPMNAIIGFTDLVLRRSGDALPGQQRDNLMKVRQSADHLLNLINDLLDLSKIEAGRMEVNPARFDVKGLIASCCDTVQPLVMPGVTLNYEVSGEVGEAHTDKARLRQIVINLLSNALKFTEKGEVRVSVVRGPWSVVRGPWSVKTKLRAKWAGKGRITNHESRITSFWRSRFLTQEWGFPRRRWATSSTNSVRWKGAIRDRRAQGLGWRSRKDGRSCWAGRYAWRARWGKGPRLRCGFRRCMRLHENPADVEGLQQFRIDTTHDRCIERGNVILIRQVGSA